MNLLDYFPHKEYRTYQKEAILSIEKSDKCFNILEIPTGGGKSAIALTHARAAKSCYIITPQKILQDQYIRDFGKYIVELKGRNAYMCNLNSKPCDEGACRKRGKYSYEECLGLERKENDAGAEYLAKNGVVSCPYYAQVELAKVAQITLMNFHSFLYQTTYTDRFGCRDLLIIDEAHNTESVLLNFFSLVLSDKDFDDLEFEEVENYPEYFEQIELRKRILYQIDYAGFNLKEREKWQNVLARYMEYMKTPSDFVPTFEKKWSRKKGVYHRIVFKPLWAKKYAARLFNYADKTIMMSATILNADVVASNLGIEEKTFIRAPSTFPVKNRQIIKRYAGSMSYKNKVETLPKMVGEIRKILELHAHERGIIHTHSFQTTDYIKNSIGELGFSRLLFQKDFESKNGMLKVHAESENSVIVAPAMHEGIDLKDDLSRFQIICKVPYPNANADRQLKARTKLSWNYYIWLTCLKLVQSYGRSVRSETDYAVTYILDSDFEKFIKQAKWTLPKWFMEAIKNMAK